MTTLIRHGRPALVVVGNPENRRVAYFRAAAGVWREDPEAGREEAGGAARREAGEASRPVDVVVLPWRRLAAGPVTLPESSVVRVDSPGEDAEVDRLLRGAAGPAGYGEIIGLAAWYRGLAAALRRLRTAADAAAASLLNDPAEILTMFDKRACHARLAAAGVPVPPALPEPPRDYAHLRAATRAAGWSRVFVKPVHGSSASGVLALAMAAGRVRATTSVERADDGRLFNSLRVRTYRDERDVAAIVDRLAPDGLHVERWFPKAGLGGRVVDLRVLVVAGEPTHVVVRASPTPLTNLHLGNARGDLAALRTAMGERAYTAALDICVRAAACFPRSLHAAVDLLVAPGWRRYAVAEVNAFGDLLPGVRSATGRGTYAEQLVAMRDGRWAR